MNSDILACPKIDRKAAIFGLSGPRHSDISDSHFRSAFLGGPRLPAWLHRPAHVTRPDRRPEGGGRKMMHRADSDGLLKLSCLQ